MADDENAMDGLGFRSLPQPEPEPQRIPVTQDDVRNYMERLRAPVARKMRQLEINEEERRGLTHDLRLERLENILEALFPEGFRRKAPQSLEELRNEWGNITEEKARETLQAQNEADFQFRWSSWNDIENAGPTYRGRTGGDNGTLEARLAALERRGNNLNVAYGAKVEPVSTAPASVVSSVFAKFYKTGLHAQ